MSDETEEPLPDQPAIWLPDSHVIPYPFEAVETVLPDLLFQEQWKSTEGIRWGCRHETTSPTSARYYFTPPDRHVIGTITVYQSGPGTVLEVSFGINSELGPYPPKDEIESMLSTLEVWVNAAIDTITASMPPVEPEKRTAVDIIKKYYLRRGQMPKLTFRQHLRDLHVEHRENYLRKAKHAYDKRRRRGKRG